MRGVTGDQLQQASFDSVANLFAKESKKTRQKHGRTTMIKKWSYVTPRIWFTQFVIQLLPFQMLSYFIFSGLGFSSVCCFRCHASHIMSSCALHLHTCSSHAFEHFPVVCFAFRRFVLLRWSFLAFFRVWGLNISGLDWDLPSGLGLLPVDRLSSSVPFGLHLILQHPSNLAQNPPKPSPSSRAFDHDRVAENRTSFGLS